MDSHIRIACMIPSAIQSVAIACSVALRVESMTAVSTAAVLVVMVAEARARAEAVINTLVEGLVVINARVGVFADVGVALAFLGTVSHSIDVVADVLIGVLSERGVDVLDTVLELTVLKSLDEFRC